MDLDLAVQMEALDLQDLLDQEDRLVDVEDLEEQDLPDLWDLVVCLELTVKVEGSE